METRSSKLCRLCLKQLNNNFEAIDNLKVGMLDVLLLKLNLSISNDPLMCQGCTAALEKAFYFKSACLSVEQEISRYAISKKNLKVDLKAVYLSQKKNEKFKIMQDNQKMCRFCLKSFDSCAMNEIGIDISLMGLLQEYFPELDLGISQPISACEKCLDGLISNFKFIMNCLDGEKQIKKYYETMGINCTEQIKLFAVLKFVEKTKSVHSVEELKTDHLQSGPKSQSSVQGPTLRCNIQNVKIVVVKPEQSEPGSSQVTKRKSPKHSAKRKKTKNLTKKCLNTDTPQIYKCGCCSFVTRHKRSIHRHLGVHKRPAEIKMHKCDKCPFISKYKASWTRHIRIQHMPPTVIYECNVCSFKGRNKSSLQLHMLKHKDASLTLYRCEHCSYQTTVKVNLTKHVLRHKSVSEATMYLCEICGFKSKHKLSLKTHELVHKSMSEVTTFKCDWCPFEAKHKGNLRMHILVHKNPSEVTMFKCNDCAFETKHKISLKTHMLQHKNPSDLVLFKCDICEFKAKYKGNLKFHIITRKDSSNTVMYQCQHCSFETKHKISLKIHVMKHKSDVAIYKCELCNFRTLYRGTLKKHMLVHKNETTPSFYPALPSCETLLEESTMKLILKDD